MSSRRVEWKNVTSTRFAGQTSTSKLWGNPLRFLHNSARHHHQNFASRDKKRDANVIMPKPSKKLFKQTPFLVKVLLFLAKCGVNINRPPPPLKTIVLFVSGVTFVLLLMFTKSSLSNVSFFALSNERPDRALIRCARTFPSVASHQLLTAEPTVKSGGLEALDYLRDGFGVRNFDVGT